MPIDPLSAILLANEIDSANVDQIALQQKALEADSNKTKTEIVTQAKPVPTFEEYNRLKTLEEYNRLQKENENLKNGISLKRTETGIGTTGKHAINKQRIEVGNKNINIIYDHLKNGNDIGRIKITPTEAFGGALYKGGDWTEKDIFYGELFTSLKIGESNILLDAGAGGGKGTLPEYFALGKLDNKDWLVESAYYNDSENIGKFKNSFFGIIGKQTGDIYTGVGVTPDKFVAVAGLINQKDLGNLTYALASREGRNWKIKTQQALTDANQGFFTKEIGDIGLEQFGIPQFFPLHFTPVMTKGGITFKGYAHGIDDKTELEAMLGINTKYAGLGLGVNTELVKSGSETGVAFELYVPMNLFGTKIDLEARYNTRTKDLTAYMMSSFELSK